MTLTDTPVSPQIAAALDELRGRVRRRFFLHGLGWVVAALTALFLAHYLLDRGLELPRLPRLALLLGIAVFMFRGIRRRLVYPVTRALTRQDIALLVERNHPSLHQELISAVQLNAAESRGDSKTLIDRVQNSAAEHLRDVDMTNVLRSERTVRVWSVAGACMLVFGLVAAFSPASFGVWAARLVGIERDYPRETFLTLEIPADQGNYRVVDTDPTETIQVQLARGAELPVNVVVKGVVPAIVELVIETQDGTERRIPMSRRGENRFRTILRRTLQPVTLYARGGDDDGTRRAIVEILIPPAATDLQTEIVAPAYTGRPAVKRDGGLVEALAGSQITIRFRSTTALEKASLEFQESQVTVEAIAVAVSEEPTAGSSDVEAKMHVARFVMPEKTDRYRLQLRAENGLAELSPSHYSVVPLPDGKPRLRIYSPGASLQAATASAKLPLRWHAKDDFGVTRVVMKSSTGGDDATESETVLFESATDDGSKKSVLEHGELRILDVAKLVMGERKPQVGDRINLTLEAVDNREPDGQVSRPQIFRIDLLEIEELRRRLQSRLRGTRSTVERALRVQEEQRTRATTFIAALSESDTERKKLAISAAEAGQQRVRGFLLQIRSEFADALDSHLFNGLDDSPEAATVLTRYEEFFSTRLELPPTDPAFWVELGRARKAGEVGRLDLLGRLDDMLVITHSLLETTNDSALRALAAASTAPNEAQFVQEMQNVSTHQKSIVEGLQRLLALLEDWNDYQDVVRITRRLRDAQRDLQDRIKSKR